MSRGVRTPLAAEHLRCIYLFYSLIVAWQDENKNKS